MKLNQVVALAVGLLLLTTTAAQAQTKFMVTVVDPFVEQPIIGAQYHPGTAAIPEESKTTCNNLGFGRVECKTTTNPGAPATPGWTESNVVVGAQIIGAVAGNGYRYTLSCSPGVFRGCVTLFGNGEYQAEVDRSRMSVYYTDGRKVKKTGYDIRAVERIAAPVVTAPSTTVPATETTPPL